MRLTILALALVPTGGTAQLSTNATASATLATQATTIASTIDQFGFAVAPITQAAEAAAASDNTPSMACIARRVIQNDGPIFTFTALVPSSDSGALTSRPVERGAKFIAIECGTRSQSLAAYKAQACELAKGNDAVQKHTEQVIGMTGSEMCDAATRLLPAQSSQP